MVHALRDGLVNSPPLFGRAAVALKMLEVAAARYDVGLGGLGHEPRNHARLVLAVAIDGNQHVVSVFERKIECRYERRAIAAILRMRHHLHVASSGQQLRRAVARTVIDDEHIRRVTQHFIQHGRNVIDFVVNRQCRQGSNHNASLLL